MVCTTPVFNISFGISFIAWLRLKSGSIWHAVLLNAGSNHVQNIFDPLSSESLTPYLVGENNCSRGNFNYCTYILDKEG
jgi:hypothetical protein